MPPKDTRRKVPKNNIYEMIYDLLLTQEQFAKKIGINKGTLNRIINRKISPGLVNAVKIARGLDECVEEVFIVE